MLEMQCQSNELDFLPKSIDKMEKLETLKVNKFWNVSKIFVKIRKYCLPKFDNFCGNIQTFSTLLFLLKVGVKQEEKKPELKEIKLNGNDVYTCKYLQAKYYETPNVYTGVYTLIYIHWRTWDSIIFPSATVRSASVLTLVALQPTIKLFC